MTTDLEHLKAAPDFALWRDRDFLIFARGTGLCPSLTMRKLKEWWARKLLTNRNKVKSPNGQWVLNKRIRMATKSDYQAACKAIAFAPEPGKNWKRERKAA